MGGGGRGGIHPGRKDADTKLTFFLFFFFEDGVLAKFKIKQDLCRDSCPQWSVVQIVTFGRSGGWGVSLLFFSFFFPFPFPFPAFIGSLPLGSYCNRACLE